MTVSIKSFVIIATSIMPIPLIKSFIKGLATHQCPFTLLRVVSVDKSGRTLFRPMWLIVMGARRDEISSVQGHQSYCQRFDLEHTFRFKKQNLLLNGFEPPVLDHEEQWIDLVNLA
jgi:hypothetical protein